MRRSLPLRRSALSSFVAEGALVLQRLDWAARLDALYLDALYLDALYLIALHSMLGLMHGSLLGFQQESVQWCIATCVQEHEDIMQRLLWLVGLQFKCP